MNYTVTISISCLLASQKTLIYRISVRSSEVLVRPSDLCPAGGTIRNLPVFSFEILRQNCITTTLSTTAMALMARWESSSRGPTAGRPSNTTRVPPTASKAAVRSTLARWQGVQIRRRRIMTGNPQHPRTNSRIQRRMAMRRRARALLGIRMRRVPFWRLQCKRRLRFKPRVRVRQW